MSFSVVVMCQNCRRETVKVTPNSSILQILEEACKRQKLNPDDFNLRHYNRTLDLSLPVRFANLPNNTQLELIPATKSRTDSTVTIGLQLENGERIMGDFLPSSTIYDVLEQSLGSKTTSLTDAGEPVCIYMRQKITGDALQSTSLRSLGLTKGSAIIRLLYRKPEELENQAHISAPLPSKSPTERETSHHPETCTYPVASDPKPTAKHPHLDHFAVDTSSKKEENQKNVSEMEVDYNENSSKDLDKQGTRSEEPEQCLKEISNSKNSMTDSEAQKLNMEFESEIPEDTFQGVGDIKYIGERHAVVYNLDDISDIKKADLPDEFFDVTINDAKYLLGEYTRQRIDLENQPLLTKEQRQRQMVQILARYDQTVIRIYFPERLVLQAVFHSVETVETIMDFLLNFLEDKSLQFYLYITPPKEKLNPFHTLIEAMLVPASVIYFGCDTQSPSYLHESLKDLLSDPRAAALAASESRKSSISTIVPVILPSQNKNVIDEENVSQDDALKHLRNRTSESKGQAPKWLKLGKR